MAKSEELEAAEDWKLRRLRGLRVAIIMFGDDPADDAKLRREGKRVEKLTPNQCLKEKGFRQWARDFWGLYPIKRKAPIKRARKPKQQSIPGVSTT